MIQVIWCLIFLNKILSSSFIYETYYIYYKHIKKNSKQNI